MGPFPSLVIRGVTVIDGTGAAPFGPATVVVEQDRITGILSSDDPAAVAAEHGAEVIDGRGQFLIPGLVDCHAHLDSTITADFGTLNDPEYVLKLWLAHGITTVRDVAALLGLDWTVEHKRRSAAGMIAAPRILVYPVFPHLEEYANPEAARQWVRDVRERGADGVKFMMGSHAPEAVLLPIAGTVVEPAAEVYHAIVDEAQSLEMGLAIHNAPNSAFTILEAARAGIDSYEHIGGLTTTRQDTDPVGGFAGCASPTSEIVRDQIAELVELGLTIDPTLAVHEALRDEMRLRTADWHADYAMPNLTEAFEPSPKSHGSAIFQDWTTTDEVQWSGLIRGCMDFLNAFKDAGGRVTTGSDAGYIYLIYGFGLIREMELLREAGFTPMEAIQAATKNGAEVVRLGHETGTIEMGKKADLVLVGEDPLRNLKVLYGTGHLRYNPETARPERVGGIRYTIRDGIVWDAQALLADVRAMVAAAKAKPE
jgi:imidazolonepropionase-like amidohydrolase